MGFEPIVVLLLFSLFFCFMVVIVLYISFHGIGSGVEPKEGNLNIFNFFDGPIWVRLTVDGEQKFRGPLSTGMTIQYDWTQSRTIEYTISKDLDPNAPDSLIVTKIVNVSPDSIVMVSVNPDGSYYEQFSTRVELNN